jgi:plastocyanin
MKPRHLTAAVAAVALSLAVVGCGDDDEPSSEPSSASSEEASGDTASSGVADAGATITIAGGSFGDPLTVEAGTTVTVVNESAEEHTLTADDGSFGTGVIAPGGSATLTFDTPGTFAFSCSIHSSMQGSITVT